MLEAKVLVQGWEIPGYILLLVLGKSLALLQTFKDTTYQDALGYFRMPSSYRLNFGTCKH